MVKKMIDAVQWDGCDECQFNERCGTRICFSGSGVDCHIQPNSKKYKRLCEFIETHCPYGTYVLLYLYNGKMMKNGDDLEIQEQK